MQPTTYKSDYRIHNERLERVGPFLIICTATFVFFAMYYLFLGQQATGEICGLGAISGAVGALATWQRPDLRAMVANAFLGLSCFILVAISLISGQRESCTTMFLCCAGLLSGHLLGVRAAVLWTFIALGCILFVNFGVNPDAIPQLQAHTHIDRLLHLLFLTLVIFLVSRQAELYFERHASSLFRTTEELQERTRLLSMAEEVALVGHWRLDTATGQVIFSAEACNICKLDPSPGVPQPLSTFLTTFPADQANRLQEAISLVRGDSDTSFSLELTSSDGDDERFITVQGICELDAQGAPMAIFGIIKDETDTKRAAAQLNEKAAALQKLAAFDVLTGLANRYRFQKELQSSITKAKQNNMQAALLLIDMDGFKDINDTLGHPIGDQILRSVADRLKDCADDGDTVARLGGDEFTVILNNVSDTADVHKQANRISDSICRPYYVANKEIRLGASIGAALCPTHSEYMDELLSFADTAMYEAKANQQQLAVYNAKMTDDLVRRRQLEAELAQALARDEFQLVYQPQYLIDAKSIIGFEALLRWERDRQTVAPMEFIPILEQSGAILPVGEWVLYQACRQAKQWIDLGYDLSISVNISPVQFRDKNFVPTVMAAIDATGLDPTRLDLEVTEGVFIKDVDVTAMKLVQLKGHGVSISIDDFGTGYSSFAYLKHFPIDRLKIDRAFVKDLPTDDDGTIASSIVGLGHNLEMKVLAEGVETPEQLRFLREESCDEIQGFLLSKPIAPPACLALLAQSESQGTEQAHV